jgi:phage terminase large subunit-like protein
MGRRGPKPTSPEALKLRGSWLVRETKGKGKGKAELKRAPSPPRSPMPKTERQWSDLLGILPNYDPFREADGYVFDVSRATRIIDFFETRLHHVKGEKARQPFLLERWQRSFLANLFGWVDEYGMRRYREALVYIPRKNGKTPMVAGIILFMLVEDGEFGAEIYGAAFEFQQASLVWQHASGMVRLDDRLDSICQLFKGQSKAIQVREQFWDQYGMSTYRVVPGSEAQAHGWNAHCGCIDELHMQPDRKLVDALETAVAARQQPIILYMTTADYEREGSICNEKNDYARGVCSGAINDARFLPCVYEADPECDWGDEQIWAAANPNLGVSVDLDYLRRAYKKAINSPSFQNTFKRFHLNIRTDQEEIWIPSDVWDGLKRAPIPMSELAAYDCWAGIDIGSTRDFTAMVLAFKLGDGTIYLSPHIWIPSKTAAERYERDRIDYPSWISQGLIHKTPGNATDYATIRRDINEILNTNRLRLREIAADRLFQGEQLTQELSELDGLNVIAHGQGFYGMAGPMRRFEELAISGKLAHDGNPILRMNVMNVVAELDASGNQKPKRDNPKRKIDAAVAAIMAVGRADGAVKRRSNPWVII